MSDLVCWICNCNKGENRQVEQILVAAQCVRCGLGASECRCHLSSSEKVQQGIASLNEWLASEIGERKLSTTASALLKATTQEHSRSQKVPAVYEAFFVRFEDSPAIDDLWIPVPREDSKFSMRSRERGLEDMGPLPRPSSSTSLWDDPGELVRESFRTVQVNQEPPEMATPKRKGVHFEEREPEKPPERRGDILWHLLPEPAPPPDRKRFGRRNRSEDVMSVGSEESTASSAGRNSQSDHWNRV